MVVLVALLALLATPSFSEARNDRTAFDYARQFQQVVVQGRARASGTGSAHLVLFGPGTAAAGSPVARGAVRLFAALDGLPSTAPGPNPISSCRADAAQWNEAQAEPVNVAGTKARFIDAADVNRGGVNTDMDLRAAFSVGSGSATANDTVAYLAVCITPSGVTYVGSGTTAAAAITEMRGQPPFTGVAEVQIQRRSGGTGVGLLRKVVITGGGAPRVRSQ